MQALCSYLAVAMLTPTHSLAAICPAITATTIFPLSCPPPLLFLTCWPFQHHVVPSCFIGPQESAGADLAITSWSLPRIMGVGPAPAVFCGVSCAAGLWCRSGEHGGAWGCCRRRAAVANMEGREWQQGAWDLSSAPGPGVTGMWILALEECWQGPRLPEQGL